MNNRRKYSGSLTIEVITAIFLLIVITAALLTSLRFYGYYNRLQWTRQRCMAAAQAQLDSIMVQNAPLSPEEIQHLWPGVKCTLSKQPGQNQWKDLDLYTATTTAQVRKRTVSIQMKRYIKSGEQH
jgi:type II secretory pathway pseudopilin PulG